MHKKYHKKFKILDILAVTTQAHKGIETSTLSQDQLQIQVTTQAHKGIETHILADFQTSHIRNNSSP